MSSRAHEAETSKVAAATDFQEHRSLGVFGKLLVTAATATALCGSPDEGALPMLSMTSASGPTLDRTDIFVDTVGVVAGKAQADDLVAGITSTGVRVLRGLQEHDFRVDESAFPGLAPLSSTSEPSFGHTGTFADPRGSTGSAARVHADELVAGVVSAGACVLRGFSRLTTDLSAKGLLDDDFDAAEGAVDFGAVASVNASILGCLSKLSADSDDDWEDPVDFNAVASVNNSVLGCFVKQALLDENIEEQKLGGALDQLVAFQDVGASVARCLAELTDGESDCDDARSTD